MVLMDIFGNSMEPDIRDGDTVLVRKRGPVVELTGDVPRDALIELTNKKQHGRHLLEVVPASAGVAEASITGFRGGRPISKTLSIEAFSDLRLEDGDTVVLSGAGLPSTILVKIEGEHLGGPVIGVKRGARLVDVLNHLAVDRELADTASIHIRRASVVQS